MGGEGQSGARKGAMSDGALLPFEKPSPEETRFSRATGDDLQAVRTLLGSCNLPNEDLTPEHLGHFVLCHVRDRLVGSVGL
jgi:amino-acid N-acetyltransferase